MSVTLFNVAIRAAASGPTGDACILTLPPVGPTKATGSGVMPRFTLDSAPIPARRFVLPEGERSTAPAPLPPLGKPVTAPVWGEGVARRTYKRTIKAQTAEPEDGPGIFTARLQRAVRKPPALGTRSGVRKREPQCGRPHGIGEQSIEPLAQQPPRRPCCRSTRNTSGN